jgi:hypothetical protein
LKQAVLKTALPERVTGVRIPLPPPSNQECSRASPLARAFVRTEVQGREYVVFCVAAQATTYTHTSDIAF